MGQSPSAKHLPQLIRYPDAEFKPTSKQQGGVGNDHMTLVRITAAPSRASSAGWPATILEKLLAMG